MDEALQFEIDDIERKHLQDMTRHPGYRVQRKILQAYIDDFREVAIAASQVDPLANRDEIARKWAYSAMAADLLTRLDAGVRFELDLLKQHQTGPLTERQRQIRHQHLVLGELDPAPDFEGENDEN